MFVSVLLPVPLSTFYTYKIPHGLTAQKGSLIYAPFGKKKSVGVVWEIIEEKGENTSFLPKEKIKDIESVLDLPPFPLECMTFIEWVAKYTLSPLGSVLKLALGEKTLFTHTPSKRKKKGSLPSEITAPVHVPLTPLQKEASLILQEQVQEKNFCVTVLDGVTGSGKTEVYFEALSEVLRQGSQGLVLLPEIALSTQWFDRFKSHFGFSPLLWHSAVSPSIKRKTWESIAHGESCIVVGARSALFLPFPKLSLLVVDEEHETSFKQEEGVLYNARDMAIVRGKIQRTPVVLVSATPSLETQVHVKEGKYKALHLPTRIGQRTLPTLNTIDMRLYAKEMRLLGKQEKETAFLSPPLREKLIESFEKGEQSLLFLNRRGYAPLLLCRNCGHRFACNNCSAWLVHHKKENCLLCHHCGYKLPVPKVCPICQAEDMLAPCGPGVERIEEEVRRFLPQAHLFILSSDKISSPSKLADIIHKMEAREIDILIGTQIVAKGHNFPGLTFVGVVDADLGLMGGDLRASERTYQVLHQVAGRSGRGENKGEVLLQTYIPNHPVMEALISGDRDHFMEEEEHARALAKMPPFGKLASLIISGPNRDHTEKTARLLAKNIPLDKNITILGPSPAPLFQLGRKFRWRFLIKASKEAPLHTFLRFWLSSIKPLGQTKITVDMDPYSFL